MTWQQIFHFYHNSFSRADNACGNMYNIPQLCQNQLACLRPEPSMNLSDYCESLKQDYLHGQQHLACHNQKMIPIIQNKKGLVLEYRIDKKSKQN